MTGAHRRGQCVPRLAGGELYLGDPDRWVVPGGWFSVYAGDSSALTGLPLHGGFSVAGGH